MVVAVCDVTASAVPVCRLCLKQFLSSHIAGDGLTSGPEGFFFEIPMRRYNGRSGKQSPSHPATNQTNAYVDHKASGPVSKQRVLHMSVWSDRDSDNTALYVPLCKAIDRRGHHDAPRQQRQCEVKTYPPTVNPFATRKRFRNRRKMLKPSLF